MLQKLLKRKIDDNSYLQDHTEYCGTPSTFYMNKKSIFVT